MGNGSDDDRGGRYVEDAVSDTIEASVSFPEPSGSIGSGQGTLDMRWSQPREFVAAATTVSKPAT